MTTVIEPIVVRGRYLYKGDDRFLVRGVFYQAHDEPPPWTSGPAVDPITDNRLSILEYDISLLNELGVNTIYVGIIDNSKEHVQAMKLLENAGIYVVAHLFSLRHYINRLAPRKSYNAETMQSFFKTVDMLAQYPNILGILPVSRSVNGRGTVGCAPIAAAVIRDLKRYMRLKNDDTGQRILPIGYGGNSWDELDKQVLCYLIAADEKDRIDFWTCPWYSSGNDSDDLVNRYLDANLPMFFTEYTALPGQQSGQPRPFDETTALFSPRMTKIFSGGCAYELLEGSNKYGLVEKRFGSQGTNVENPDIVAYTRQESWGTLFVFKDFENYKARLAETRHVLPSTNWEMDTTADSDARAQAQEQMSRHLKLMDEDGIPDTCVDWEQI